MLAACLVPENRALLVLCTGSFGESVISPADAERDLRVEQQSQERNLRTTLQHRERQKKSLNIRHNEALEKLAGTVELVECALVRIEAALTGSGGNTGEMAKLAAVAAAVTDPEAKPEVPAPASAAPVEAAVAPPAEVPPVEPVAAEPVAAEPVAAEPATGEPKTGERMPADTPLRSEPPAPEQSDPVLFIEEDDADEQPARPDVQSASTGLSSDDDPAAAADALKRLLNRAPDADGDPDAAAEALRRLLRPDAKPEPAPQADAAPAANPLTQSLEQRLTAEPIEPRGSEPRAPVPGPGDEPPAASLNQAAPSSMADTCVPDPRTMPSHMAAPQPHAGAPAPTPEPPQPEAPPYQLDKPVHPPAAQQQGSSIGIVPPGEPLQDGAVAPAQPGDQPPAQPARDLDAGQPAAVKNWLQEN